MANASLGNTTLPSVNQPNIAVIVITGRMKQATATTSRTQCHPAVIPEAPLLDVIITTTVLHTEIKITATIIAIIIVAITREATMEVDVDLILLAVTPAAITVE